MPDLELTRTPGERRLYTLAGVGALRLQGLFSRAATADADGKTWRFARGRLLAAQNRGDGHRRHNRRRVRAEHAAPWRHTPLERPRAQAAAKQRLARALRTR